MASLRYRWNKARTAISVLSPRMEVLSRLEVPEGTSDREAAFLGLDAALATARLKRSDVTGVRGLRRLALYNPYTAQIAVGSIPRTISYSDGHPLEIPLEGLPARIEDDVLWAAERIFESLQLDYEDVNACLAAHNV